MNSEPINTLDPARNRTPLLNGVTPLLPLLLAAVFISLPK